MCILCNPLCISSAIHCSPLPLCATLVASKKICPLTWWLWARIKFYFSKCDKLGLLHIVRMREGVTASRWQSTYLSLIYNHNPNSQSALDLTDHQEQLHSRGQICIIHSFSVQCSSNWLWFFLSHGTLTLAIFGPSTKLHSSWWFQNVFWQCGGQYMPFANPPIELMHMRML